MEVTAVLRGPMSDELITEHDLVNGIVRHLRERGSVVERAQVRDGFLVRSYRDTAFPLEPLLMMPPALLEEYLEELSRRVGDERDPSGEALSLTRIHLVEELATDHGDGLNYVRALGFRRKRGKVELFVEQEIPQAGSRPPSSSADLEWRADPPRAE